MIVLKIQCSNYCKVENRNFFNNNQVVSFTDFSIIIEFQIKTTVHFLEFNRSRYFTCDAYFNEILIENETQTFEKKNKKNEFY